MAYLFAFLSAISAALVAIFGKLGLKTLDSTLATTIRSIIMAVFLVLTSLALKKFGGFLSGAAGFKDRRNSRLESGRGRDLNGRRRRF